MGKVTIAALAVAAAFMLGLHKGRDIGRSEAPELAIKRGEVINLLESTLDQGVASFAPDPSTREEVCDLFFEHASDILAGEWVHMLPEQEMR